MNIIISIFHFKFVYLQKRQSGKMCLQHFFEGRSFFLCPSSFCYFAVNILFLHKREGYIILLVYLQKAREWQTKDPTTFLEGQSFISVLFHFNNIAFNILFSLEVNVRKLHKMLIFNYLIKFSL